MQLSFFFISSRFCIAIGFYQHRLFLLQVNGAFYISQRILGFGEDFIVLYSFFIRGISQCGSGCWHAAGHIIVMHWHGQLIIVRILPDLKFGSCF